MVITQYMGLTVWNLQTDDYNSTQLATNFGQIDQHDHSPGNGKQISTAGIAANSITGALIAPNTITSSNIQPGSITSTSLKTGAVTASNIASGAIATILGDTGWTSITPINNWSSGTSNPAIRIVDGIAYLSGQFTALSSASPVCCILPPAADPTNSRFIISAYLPNGGSLIAKSLEISTQGLLVIGNVTPASGDVFYLDGLSFRVQ